MTVQRHTSLKTQGVTRSQTRRNHAERLTGSSQLVPQLNCVLVRYEQLEAVLTGVAGAGQQNVNAGDGQRHGCVVLQLAHGILVRGTGCQQNLLRARALNSNQGGLIRLIHELNVEITQALAHRCEVSVNVRSVRNDHEFLIAQTVSNQVVNDAALVVDQDRVLCLTDLQDGHVRHQSVIQERARIRTGHTELTHVGQVENTGTSTDSLMLSNVISVLQGHIPAAEVGERSAKLLVDRVQRGLLGGH